MTGTLVDSRSSRIARRRSTMPAPRSARGALVLGGDYRGLGTVRSLGRRGIPVWVIEDGSDVIASFSRYARGRIAAPEGDDPVKLAFLLDLGRRSEFRGWSLFPTGDESARLIAQNHDELARHFVLTTPRWSVFRWAYDKRLTYELAGRLEIATPRTWYPSSHSELETLGVDFPAVLKPAVKPSFNRLTAAKAWRVDDLDELRARYAEACDLVDPSVLVIQEVVDGDGESQLSFAALCEQGTTRATIVARRTRQYPPDFGRASTYVETIDCAEVVEPSRRLLAAMRFSGLVEVEYKRDGRDGSLKLLDVNPRVWGWHSIGHAAGPDFPFLAWELAHGRPVPQVVARPGVRWIRMSTDLPTSLRQIVRRKLGIRSFVASLRHVEGAIFQRDDPLPAIVEYPLLLRLLLRRVRLGHGV